MGRHKVIGEDAVLDAALRAIKREGATGMSIDAVATEAGICKASVLYDFKTKRGLIHALIRRQIEIYEQRLEEKREGSISSENSEIDAIIAVAADYAISDDDRAEAMNLCAALVQDKEMRDIVRESFQRRMSGIAKSATHPRGALLAFFAIEGLMFFGRLGLPDWSPGERERLLKEIIWLARQEPPSELTA